MFLYRDEYYISRKLGGASENTTANESERRKLMETKNRLEKVLGISEFIVSKNRKSPTDTIHLLFQAETTTFQNLAHHPMAV
ncbi:MAG TPA: DnaB-like helicase C-terminal domain-containing protein [Rhizomicrobium sp.]|nr:DnaB-like helicase C-terminal domain-containing protein [Rhizomicrobium sp.]